MARVSEVPFIRKGVRATRKYSEMERKFEYMERGYVWQAEYGRRKHLTSVFKQLIEEQDASSLEMLEIFVNNNPYNLEFFIAVTYDVPQKKSCGEDDRVI